MARESVESFNDFINNKIFKWYKTVTPYELLVGSELNLKTYNAGNNQTKAITNIKEAYAPFCAQIKTYLVTFISKYVVDTQTAMRCDLITELFGALSKNLNKKLAEEMKTKNIYIDHYKSQNVNKQLFQDFENCKSEKQQLKDLIKQIESLEQEYLQAQNK